MLRFLLIFFLSFIFGCGASQTVEQNEPFNFIGNWEGIAAQNSPNVSLPFTLQLSNNEEGELIGEVIYLDNDCSGRLIPTETFLFFTEEIDHGRTRCVSGGTVSLEEFGEQIAWTWTDDSIEASATLSRVVDTQCGE